MTLSIAIAGGGIAGLTAALALAKNGYSVRIFERAKALEDIGAGIQLSPNAGKVLAALGLAEAVKDVSFEPEILQLVNGKTGRTLNTLPFRAMMQQRYGAPYLVAHRGDLQSMLLEAVRQTSNIKIETGALIGRFQNQADGVDIAGQNFNLLIVADGIGSTLRAQIDPIAKVVADGQIAWRATLPVEYVPSFQNGVTAFLNSGAHLVAYKMGQRPELNLVYVSNGNKEPSGNGFGGSSAELIKAAKNWKAWPLASVQSKTWHNARAVMIGDAAHAMTPHAAQGGTMAIEDAMVLANCLKKNANIESALASFQTQRQPRVERVEALSKQNRAIYQSNGLIAFGRNIVMPLLPPDLLLRRLDWLYGWQA